MMYEIWRIPDIYYLLAKNSQPLPTGSKSGCYAEDVETYCYEGFSLFLDNIRVSYTKALFSDKI
jgi:hypothetical protein